jgi:hypothetical protein
MSVLLLLPHKYMLNSLGYCGNAFASKATNVFDSDCNVPCVGNGLEVCGAPFRLSIFVLQSVAASLPSPTPTPPVSQSAPSYQAAVNGYSLVGCQAESANGGALSDMTIASVSMTNEFCA